MEPNTESVTNMANRLPGMEDAQIEALDSLALDYKKLQRKRITALAKEVELKGKLLEEMKTQKKKHYKYEDIEIEIVPTGEKLKVKISKEEENGDAE
jgi:hypothetical protein